MSHPTNRAERRHQRDRVIAKRRFIHDHVWTDSHRVQERTNLINRVHPTEPSAWGRYSKWNLGCGSKLCHADKYFGHKRKRREAHKRAAQGGHQEYLE